MIILQFGQIILHGTSDGEIIFYLNEADFYLHYF